VYDNRTRRALSGYQGIPSLLQWLADDPGEDGAGAHKDIGGDNDEYDEPAHPAFGQAQNGEAEARLGPDGGGDHQGAGYGDAEGKVGQLGDVEVPRVLPVAQRCEIGYDGCESH